MANDNVITIVIKSEDVAASSSATISEKNIKEKKELTPMQKMLKKILHPIGTIESETFNALGSNYERFYQTVKQNVQVFANQSLNRYYSITEDYMGENYKQNFDKAMNVAENILSSTIQGALTGNVVGAVIGAGSAIASTIASERQRMNNYYADLNATNYQTEFNRTRSVLVDNNRNTEG